MCLYARGRPIPTACVQGHGRRTQAVDLDRWQSRADRGAEERQATERRDADTGWRPRKTPAEMHTRI